MERTLVFCHILRKMHTYLIYYDLDQGMMDFVSSDHGIAKDLRKYVIFKFFPVVCPDGVFLGNSRCTLLGADLNRSWHKANEFHHPVLWKIKKYIIELHDVSM